MKKPEVKNSELDQRHVCRCFMCEQMVIYPLCANCAGGLDKYERAWIRNRTLKEIWAKIKSRWWK